MLNRVIIFLVLLSAIFSGTLVFFPGIFQPENSDSFPLTIQKPEEIRRILKKKINRRLQHVKWINPDVPRLQFADRLTLYADKVLSLRSENRRLSEQTIGALVNRLFLSNLSYIDCPNPQNWNCLDQSNPFLLNNKYLFRIDNHPRLTQEQLLGDPFAITIRASSFGWRLLADGEIKKAGLHRNLLDFLGRARDEILISAYQFDKLPAVVQLLKQRAKEGVLVKLVLDKKKKPDKSPHAGPTGTPNPHRPEDENNWPPSIQIKYESNAVAAAMHNKFVVIDGKTVWTGTANFTARALIEELHANVILEIKSSPVAHAFRQEFFEMFSGVNIVESRLLPSVQKKQASALFHRAKRPNTFRNFYYPPQDVRLRVFFAPTDDGEHRAIIPAINGAQHSLRISMFSTGYSETVAALFQAADRGVRIQIILDGWGAGGSNSWVVPRYFRGICEYVPYQNKTKGIPRKSTGQIDLQIENWQGLNHEKLAIIDDRLLLIGSQNWSQAGNDINDENLLLIDSGCQNCPVRRQIKKLAARFDRMWHDLRQSNAKTCQNYAKGLSMTKGRKTVAKPR